MTQDEIIEMAKESNLLGVIDSFHYETNIWVEEATAFAKLIAAKEREACAKVADGWSKRDDDVGAFVAKTIRARGEA